MPVHSQLAVPNIDDITLVLVVAVIAYIVGPWIKSRQDAGAVREQNAWTSLRAEVEGLRKMIDVQRVEIDQLEEERDKLHDQLLESRSTLAVTEVELMRLRERVEYLEMHQS